VPIYVQIVNQVKYLVGSGRLSPGGEVPPIRVLAQQLLVNPNTVARAYLELERGRRSHQTPRLRHLISEAGSPLARASGSKS